MVGVLFSCLPYLAGSVRNYVGHTAELAFTVSKRASPWSQLLRWRVVTHDRELTSRLTVLS
jgi:hypothetical protein